MHLKSMLLYQVGHQGIRIKRSNKKQLDSVWDDSEFLNNRFETLVAASNFKLILIMVINITDQNIKIGYIL
jgi:hypothetical protein